MLRNIASSRFALARVARAQVVAQRRTFIRPTASLQADFVQDLYLRELKNYKVPAPGPNDAKGHVQEFTPPAAPASPEETDLAKELQAYETQTVEVEGQAVEGETAAVEENWFVEEEDDEAGAAH